MERYLLIQARLEKCLSQQEAANNLGVHRNTIIKWEKGVDTPHPHYVKLLCNFYDKSPQELGLSPAITRREMLGTLVAPIALELHPEEATSLCALGLPALWELYFTGNMEHVACLAPLYKAHISRLIEQPPLLLQKQVAALASQLYQLAYEIAVDQENYTVAQDMAQRAVLYAQSSENAHLQVASLIRLGDMFFHQRQPTYALNSYQQAIPLLSQATPLLRGRLHVAIAEIQAMRGEKQEALKAIGLAEEYYPERPEEDPAYSYTRYSHYALRIFGKVQSFLFLGEPQEAVEQLSYVESHLIDPQAEPLSRLDLLYYHTSTAIALGHLEESCQLVQSAAELSIQLKSKLYFQKIIENYQQMRMRWKNEKKVEELETIFRTF